MTKLGAILMAIALSMSILILKAGESDSASHDHNNRSNSNPSPAQQSQSTSSAQARPSHEASNGASQEARSAAPSVSPVEMPSQTKDQERPNLIITIGEISLTATLAENSSAKELSKLLMNRSITIPMKDYGGFEKVGPLGQNLPTNDEPISTKAGDLILYQGNSFVIYYSTNSWNFTRLGQIDNITADELKQILGSGDITVTLSITK